VSADPVPNEDRRRPVAVFPGGELRTLSALMATDTVDRPAVAMPAEHDSHV
jgi:hypothetical protein